MRKASDQIKNQAGFTLIELVMVLVIVGITIAFFSTSLFNLRKDTAHSLTQKRVDAVADVVRRYAVYNRRLPCPASPQQGQEHKEFGWFDNNATTCSNANGIHTNGSISVGMVPVASLNLPTSFAYDAWGSRLMLAVSPNMVSRTTYKSATPTLTVDGTPVPFVVFSVGPDRKGGYTSQQTTGGPAVPCTSSPGLDQENCDYTSDTEFTYRMQSTAPGANYYDDVLAFRFLPRAKNDFMPDAVMAFRLTACPSGWTRHVPATGRSIIGATVSGATLPSGTLGAKPGYSGQTFANVGDIGGAPTRTDQSGGSVYFNMPPYVHRGIIYCKKD